MPCLPAGRPLRGFLLTRYDELLTVLACGGGVGRRLRVPAVAWLSIDRKKTYLTLIFNLLSNSNENSEC